MLNNDGMNEAILNKLEQDLKREGLDYESLITIVKEFSRISRQSSHKQIHVLLDLLRAIEMAVEMVHMSKAMAEDGEGHE